ncbi:glycosyl transferase, family 2 [Desulforamulus reducens MI-1]|uniref:Glycosyl transferase, family 2 n=1 Tax=Desulforamulus reducens (strain ATCC BAA-1160 / DSM 100696 / MI-1) TaxID=349161 RepID=A4J4C0_DESRM|nr:glycosyltransferase [Desulforamulus reducens]ABO49923.1 glycosyl transferase, family 2 [Desulforamulus reducens MI-1]
MISVIMPVYNGAEFLKETIESVLNQTEKNFELIIINDGSTDQSEDVILSFSDPRILYFKQENSGAAAARNRGLEKACGDFVVIQDADDISLPNRFEVLKSQFTSPTVGIVHSDVLLINEENHPMGYWAASNIEKSSMLRFFLKIGTPFNNNSLMLRRKALENLRYDPSLRIGEDTEMISHVAKSWDAVHVPKPLLLYRRHTNNLTNEKDYHVLFAHMQKFLDSHTLEELVPELDWHNAELKENQARACAIISLFLLRRRMVHDCQAWYNRSLETLNGSNDSIVNAIGHIILGNYKNALNFLHSYPEQNPVVENYVGETYALLGQMEKAFAHFLKALQLNPLYLEPLDNLKAIGGLKGLNLLDRSWNNFLFANN